jgi:hypothetical protein
MAEKGAIQMMRIFITLPLVFIFAGYISADALKDVDRALTKLDAEIESRINDLDNWSLPEATGITRSAIKIGKGVIFIIELHNTKVTSPPPPPGLIMGFNKEHMKKVKKELYTTILSDVFYRRSLNYGYEYTFVLFDSFGSNVGLVSVDGKMSVVYSEGE